MMELPAGADSTTAATHAPEQGHALDESIDLMELVTSFVLQWRLLAVVWVVCFLIGLAYVFSVKPLFEASASILPQGRDDSSNLASFFSGRSPGDIFTGLLASRSVADGVVDRANLLSLYGTDSREVARAILAGRSVFSTGRDTLVTIRVRDPNAAAAQKITNAYLDALQDQRETLLAHEAEQHDRFFLEQLSRESEALAKAEQELKSVEETTGVLQPDVQTSLGLNSIANVRAQITQLTVELSALEVGATEDNPRVKALRAELAQLRAQEGSLESAGAAGGTGAAASARKMPQLNLEYARKVREVKYHEALFTSISTQFENARLTEGYAGAPFVVIDHAIAPSQKAYPPRRLMLLLSIVFSLIAGILAVGLRLIGTRLMRDPLQAGRLRQMRQSFGFKR